MTGREHSTRSEERSPASSLGRAEPGALADLAPKGTVLLLLSGEKDRSWAAEVAIALSSGWARQGRRIVLADLHLEDPLLHHDLGVPNLEGIVDIFLYGASLSRSARPVRDGSFFLIPAGTYTTDLEEIYRHPRWKKLVAGFRGTNATLVLFAPAEGIDLAAVAQWCSEVAMLGTVPPSIRSEVERLGMELSGTIEPPLAGRPASNDSESGTEAALLGSTGVVDPDVAEETPIPSPAAGVDDGSVGTALGSLDFELELPPPPARRRSTQWGVPGLVWGLLALIVIGIAGYALLTLRPSLLTPTELTFPEATLPDSAALLPAPRRVGALLPYSVQVKAFTSFAAAQAEVEREERRLGDISLFISPEEIQGILYYKILAGLSTDTLGATRLRDRLVEVGSVDPEDAAGSWSLLQFTPLAFDLGEFSSKEEASVHADSLGAQKIPAYRAEVPYSDGSRRWQLYGGAFRDSTSASGMGRLLAGAGMYPPLITRSGVAAVLPE